MLIPVLTVRRILILGLVVVALVALADGVARHELRTATRAMTLADAAPQADRASDE
ncbi:hypothetical protein LOK46_31525 (plasmid) [Methylobacterium sp. NMS14P]|uniref:hypothetical protein n=1 Tax=Methylobacterium sp. NMS14P TaxID=2894310 RepID=UPI0023586932|nr:hypothetical protein [Methylobacterium sp. NMS14P]WCS28449.1 hypothetical protein LOK46_31525 [Methylobacterium sp. NMS14P]